MAMHRRLYGALLAILIFFSLNLGVHVWGDRARAKSLAGLRRGIDRQLLIASMKRHLRETSREMALLAGVLGAPGSGSMSPEVRAELVTRLDQIDT